MGYFIEPARKNAIVPARQGGRDVSFVYEIDMASGVLCQRGVGEVTADDFRNQLMEEIWHPDFHPGLDRIVDYRRLHPCLSLEEIERLATTVRRLGPVIGDSRWAVVTDLDLVHDLMFKLIAFCEGTRVEAKVFRNMDEAKAWLGLKKDYQCPLVTPEAV